jgi:hypothetical protein
MNGRSITVPVSVLIMLVIAWPAMASEELSPRAWYFLLNHHLARSAPVRTEPLDPLTLAHSAMPVCDRPETRDCRNMDRLPEAIDTASSWWRDPNREKLEAVLARASTDDQKIAVRQLKAMKEIVKHATAALARDPSTPRTVDDIWGYSLIVVGFDRLFLSIGLDYQGYWTEREGGDLLEQGEFGRYVDLQIEASAYYAASLRVARLCRLLDAKRENELCLAMTAYDDSYEAAAERYDQALDRKLDDADRAITTITTAYEAKPDHFPILLGEYLRPMQGAVPSLRAIAAEDRAGYARYDAASADDLASPETVANLEALFGAPTKYRSASNGN